MGKSAQREVVVVTGASAGVRRAVVHAFAKRGARVDLLARGERGLEDARREVESLGGEALGLPTDVADPRQVEEAARAVEECFGLIEVWVNDAMATLLSPLLETTDEDFKRATEVTYLGGVYGTRAVLKRMVPRDRGTVVHVGPALAYRAIPSSPTAARSTGGAASPTPCEPSSCTSAARSGSRASTCLRSTPLSSAGDGRGCPTTPTPSRPSTSPRFPRRPCTTLPISAAGSSTSAGPPSRRSSATSSSPASPTATWRRPASSRSRSTACRSIPIGRTTFSSPSSRRRTRTACSTSAPGTQPAAVADHAPSAHRHRASGPRRRRHVWHCPKPAGSFSNMDAGGMPRAPRVAFGVHLHGQRPDE